MCGTGNHIKMPIMLKNRWTKAMCKVLNFKFTKAAIIAVIVVPMFAPRVMGNIFFNGRTPAPQSGVKAEVVTEEDCTMMVMPIPMAIAK